METGEVPTRSRAILRAVVLAPLLYVPPLQLLLAFWVRASSLHRGPHDLLANTIVVEPGYRPHTFVRVPPVVPVSLPVVPLGAHPLLTARPAPPPQVPPAPFAPPVRLPPPPPNVPGPF